MTEGTLIAATADTLGEEVPAASTKASAVEEWALHICTLCPGGGEHTLALGKALFAAKQALVRGEWAELWRSGGIPFKIRKGEMLATIGQMRTPGQFGQRFQFKSDTESNPNRTPIPGQIGQ